MIRRISLSLLLLAAGCAPSADEARVAARAAALPLPSAAGLARLAALPASYRAGDPERGRTVYVLCADCHSLGAGGPETAGPTLAGFMGARAATRGTYGYSSALRNSGVTWDVRQLDRWLFNPHEMVPATRMAFIGIRNDRKRRDTIAYLVAVTEPQSGAKQ